MGPGDDFSLSLVCEKGAGGRGEAIIQKKNRERKVEESSITQGKDRRKGGEKGKIAALNYSSYRTGRNSRRPFNEKGSRKESLTTCKPLRGKYKRSSTRERKAKI